MPGEKPQEKTNNKNRKLKRWEIDQRKRQKQTGIAVAGGVVLLSVLGGIIYFGSREKDTSPTDSQTDREESDSLEETAQRMFTEMYPDLVREHPELIPVVTRGYEISLTPYEGNSSWSTGLTFEEYDEDQSGGSVTTYFNKDGSVYLTEIQILVGAEVEYSLAVLEKEYNTMHAAELLRKEYEKRGAHLGKDFFLKEGPGWEGDPYTEDYAAILDYLAWRTLPKDLREILLPGADVEDWTGLNIEDVQHARELMKINKIRKAPLNTVEQLLQ